jgi:hypothetical protein
MVDASPKTYVIGVVPIMLEDGTKRFKANIYKSSSKVPNTAVDVIYTQSSNIEEVNRRLAGVVRSLKSKNNSEALKASKMPKRLTIDANPSFKFGTLVRHYDGIGKGHLGFVIRSDEDYADLVFVSTNKNWTKFSVELPNQYNDMIKHLVFGKSRDNYKQSFLCYNSGIPIDQLSVLATIDYVPNELIDFVKTNCKSWK